MANIRKKIAFLDCFVLAAQKNETIQKVKLFRKLTPAQNRLG